MTCRETPPLPPSCGRHVTIRNCEFDCDVFFSVKPDEEHYQLSDFTMENLKITAADISFDTSFIADVKEKGIILTEKEKPEFPDAVTTI